MKLSLLSPEKKYLDSIDVSWVIINGSEGEIQILPGHVNMIGTLETGRFIYQSSSGEETLGVISFGFFEIDSDNIVVLAQTIEFSDEIDIKRAKISEKMSEKKLLSDELDVDGFSKYQMKLKRALVRQIFAKKH